MTPLFLALAGLLNACFQGVDANDYILTRNPVVDVSTTETGAGRFVTAEVSTYLLLPDRSRVSQRSGEVEVGFCFQDASESALDCPRYSFETPAAVSLEDGSTISTRQSVVVRSGTQVDLTHTVAFTLTRPGAVKVVGVIFSRSGDLRASSVSDEVETATVRFR